MTSELKHFLQSTKEVREGLKRRAQFSQHRQVPPQDTDLWGVYTEKPDSFGHQAHRLSEPTGLGEDQSTTFLPKLKHSANLSPSLTHPSRLEAKTKCSPYSKVRMPRVTKAKPQRWILIKKAYLYPETRVRRLLKAYKQAPFTN